jgi:hypothetical protein
MVVRFPTLPLRPLPWRAEETRWQSQGLRPNRRGIPSSAPSSGHPSEVEIAVKMRRSALADVRMRGNAYPANPIEGYEAA